MTVATKMILQIVADSWILRVAWNTVDPYVHSICEETKELLFVPDTGFARPINVTVGIALLVSWAARSNIIAVRVLQQLITGRDGSAQDWKKVKRRLQHIEKQMKKELKNSQKWYCPESVDARLRSPFFLEEDEADSDSNASRGGPDDEENAGETLGEAECSVATHVEENGAAMAV